MKRVLLVEDLPQLRRVLEKTLAKLGLDSLCVNEGKSALAALDQREFDLVITDISMPVMDGLELIQNIRLKLKKEVPVIAYTGGLNSRPEMIAPFLKSATKIGADAVLRKPFSAEELRQAIYEVFGPLGANDVAGSIPRAKAIL